MRFNKSFNLEKRVFVPSSDTVQDLDPRQLFTINLFPVFHEAKPDVEFVFIVISFEADIYVSSFSKCGRMLVLSLGWMGLGTCRLGAEVIHD